MWNTNCIENFVQPQSLLPPNRYLIHPASTPNSLFQSGVTSLLFVCANLHNSHILYTWSYIICFLVSVFFHLTRCFQGSLYFSSWIRTSFCIVDKYYIIQWIYIPWICMYVCITIFSLTLVMELGCFLLLSVVDSVTMDICINNLLEPFSVL